MLDDTTTAGAGAPAATTDFAELRRERFPGLRFRKVDLTHAGRIAKKAGPETALLYLDGRGEAFPDDARPPAKCNIVAWSRSPAEWPIAIASRDVQAAMFKRRLEEFALLESGFAKTPEGRAFVLRRLGVHAKNIHAQAINLIIPNALKIYRGVLVKVDNHNEKIAARHARVTERRLAEGLNVEDAPLAKKATSSDGYLLEPPGVNPSIYCYQQVSPRPVLHTKGIVGVPARFQGYARDPDAPVRLTGTKFDRRSIRPGQPGHIPEWQYPLLSRKTNRRVRAWYNEASNKPKKGRRPESPDRARARELARDQGALLVNIKIGEDWLLLDARGLLRNVVYRGLASDGLTLQGLLDMFSGDPVIDPVRRVVTFLYKERVVPIRKRTTTSTKKAPALLAQLVAEHGTIGMVTIDLGQTNPVAGRVSRIGRDLDHPEFVSQLALPDELIRMWARYRSDSDQLEARLEREAIALLPSEHLAEIARVKAYCPADGRRSLTDRFQVDLSDLPWDQMSSGTYHIADRIIRDRVELAELLHFDNTKKGRLKRTDHNIYKWTRPKVARETRDLLSATTWDLKRASDEYAKLALRKRELSRRCSNWLVRETRRMTRCEQVVVNVEALNVRFFHGCGKRDIGWDHFFERKRENRWLIQALHRALTELAPHQGIPVVEANPARTSITCPRCGYCDRQNRYGETFHCLSCGVDLHADFEVATMNLERVTLTGQALPTPPRERLGKARNPTGARKTRTKQNSKAKGSPEVGYLRVVL